MVLGFALETQYELTVDLVETQRELRPAATLALGQASQLPLPRPMHQPENELLSLRVLLCVCKPLFADQSSCDTVILGLMHR